MAEKSKQAKQEGVALLAALIFMLALVLTLGNIFYAHQLDVGRLTKSLHSDQALLLALSAENWAQQLLSTDQDDREVDSLEENWALAVPVLPVEGGFLRGCLQGESEFICFIRWRTTACRNGESGEWFGKTLAWVIARE